MKAIGKLLEENPGLYEELRYRRKRQANRARVLLDELKANYQVVFDEDKPLPMTADVIPDIRSRYQEYSRAEIEQALHIWCKQKAYRNALLETDVRYDLDGVEVRL